MRTPLLDGIINATLSLEKRGTGGSAIHMFPVMEHGEMHPHTTSAVRDTNLDELLNIADRDFIIVRPRVTPEERIAAIRRARSLAGKRYSTKDLVLTGLAPSLVKGDVDPSKDVGAICSAIIAYAYPGVDFRPGYSQRVVRPGDLHRSPFVDEIAAFSADPSLSKSAEIQEGDLLTDIPQARTLEEFRKYLQPGDILLTKPNKHFKTKKTPIAQWIGGTGWAGELQKKLNLDDAWAHAAIWAGEERNTK